MKLYSAGLTLFALSALFLSAQAHAVDYSTNPAIIYSVNHYEQNGSCSAYSTTCKILFTPAPAGKLINIKLVTCYLQSDGNVIFASLEVVQSVGAQLTRLQTMDYHQVAVENAIKYYMAHHETEFGVGAIPVVRVIAAPGSDLIIADCQISGLLTPK